MGFTKKELYEIEHVFDVYSGQTLHGIAIIAERLKGTTATRELFAKATREITEDYDRFRTIAAKAAGMREKKEKE